MRSMMLGGAAVIGAIALGGCDSGSVAYVSAVDGPSAATAFVASVRPAAAVMAGPNAIGLSRCEVVISASQRVDLHEVTIHMVDGSNLGGPMVTFPPATLTKTFGSTFVAAGATRVFSLPCTAPTRAGSVLVADIACIDANAFVHRITVRSPWS